jgi:hypothetical protein
MARIWADRVRDSTTTTGTGTITVSGSAPRAFQAFGAKLSTNDTFLYAIVSQSANEWEVGEGIWLGSNQFSRSAALVRDGSSGVATLVNFSGGTKDVWIDFPAKFGSREVLASTRNFYVRTDGSDSNNGLSNTAGGAFLTVDKAIAVGSSTLDIGGQIFNINIADGAYGTCTLLDWVGTSPDQYVNIIGNTTTPANVTFTSTTSFVPPIACFSTTKAWKLQGIKLIASGAAAFTPLLWVIGNSCNVRVSNMDFGAARTDSPQICVEAGGFLDFVGSNNFSGATAGYMILADQAGMVATNGATTYVFSNNPNYSSSTINSSKGGVVNMPSATFTNGATVTGTRFVNDSGGGINTSGGGANYFPGNVAGTTTAPGWYT